MSRYASMSFCQLDWKLVLLFAMFPLHVSGLREFKREAISRTFLVPDNMLYIYNRHNLYQTLSNYIFIYTYIWHHIWYVLCCVHETWQYCLAKSAKWLSVHSCCQDVGGNPEVKSFELHLHCCWDLERKKQLATSAGLWLRWASQNDAVMQCFASNCKASCSKLQHSMVISRLNTN